MKILLVSLWSISEESIGGTEKFVVDLARGLSKSHSVTILSLGRMNVAIENVTMASLNIVECLDEYSFAVHLRQKGLVEISEKLKIFLKDQTFDVVHCNSLFFAGLVEGIPTIHTVHTNQEEFKNSFPREITNSILENVKKDESIAYVVPSAFAEESFKILTGKTSTIISHAFVADIELQDKTVIRKIYGISEDDVVFCLPSRLEIKQKGQEILLRALMNIKEKLPPFTVVLGGCDKQYIENKRYLEKHYSNLKIVFEAFPTKNDLYSISDVIVLPSKTESFGYAALESTAMGFLVFLSNILPYQEIAKGSPRSILFENSEIGLSQILLEHLDEIIAHEILPPPVQWGERYSQGLMIQKYLSVYNEKISAFSRCSV